MQLRHYQAHNHGDERRLNPKKLVLLRQAVQRSHEGLKGDVGALHGLGDGGLLSGECLLGGYLGWLLRLL